MSEESIVGAKAGGGEQRKPNIAPDSARSVTRLQQVVGLSEGEIKGFGINNIKLDGTPLSALSTGIKCDYRFGSSNQTSIDGVDEVANEMGVGVELRSDREWIKAITNTNLDALGLRLRWSPLVTNHENGDRTGVRIVYKVYIAPASGSYSLVLDGLIDDKTTDSYERYHEFKLPPSDNGWMIRVVRETENSESSLITDKMYVQAYAEIVKSKFNYPFTSLISLEYDAQTFPNIAKVSVEAEGMIIKVPTNYNPETRVYTGIWNGLFKLAYTNNPAWVYYDLVTNPRYGLGDKIKANMVDKWALYKLAMYCDQMISDGYGNTEPRFTCNVYLQSKERAYDILNRLTGLFRAINFWSGTEIVVDADIPQDTSYLYTNANVVDGLFEYAGTPATERYSVVKVAWDNPLNAYSTEYEAVSYEHLIKELGFRVLEIDAWGCTSRGQALRAGRWALLAETDTVTFKVGMDGYLALPGKVIEIQDEFYAGKSNGGRIKSIDVTRKIITVDRDVSTIAGDTLSINTNSGEVLKYNIVSSNGKIITLLNEIDSSIDDLSIWVINSSTLVTQKYRVMTVKYEDVGEFTISATAYNPNKYEEIDSNIVFDEPPTSLVNPIAQDSVTDVQIESTNLVYQGLNNVNLTIKWVRAVNAVEYLVEFKKDNGSWLKLPTTGNSSITLDNIYAGTYLARVTAMSAFGLSSLPAYSVNTDVLGKLLPPSPPLNFRTSPAMFAVNVLWDFPTNSKDVAYTRIQASLVDPATLLNFDNVTEIDRTYPETKLTVDGMRIGYPKWFRAKLVDKLGFESPFTEWVQGESNEDPASVIELISGHISEGTLDQTLKGKIDGAGALAGEAQTLANQANTAAANAQTTANNAVTAAADAAGKATAAANAAAKEATDRAAALTTQSNTLMADSAAKVKALKDEVDPKITTLQNGITQVTTDYKAADTVVVGQLNAYKTSNDSSVASVLQKAESAVSTGAANSSAITAINGQVTTINGTLAQKLDASVINNYYTKVQADTAASGQITAFDASLQIGGSNLLSYTSNFESSWAKGSQYPTATVTVLANGEAEFVNTQNGWNQWQCQSTANPALATIEVGKTYTLSAEFMAIDEASAASCIPWLSIREQVTTSITFNPISTAVSAGTLIANKWVKISVTGVLTSEGTRLYWRAISGMNQIGTVRIRRIQLEEGTKATQWSPSYIDVAASLDANASAIQTTNTEVTRIDGLTTSNSNAITSLQNDLVTTNNNVATKAAASALSALETRVTNAEGVNTSQGSSITNLNNSLTTTNTNVTAAQTAADNANTLAGGKGKVIVQSSAPAVADRLPQNLWIDTTGNANTPKRWLTNAWVAVSDKIATDAAAAAAAANTALTTKADASALTSLTTRVAAEEGKSTSQGTAITNLENSLALTDAAVATKAASSALTTLDSKVTVIDGKTTSNADNTTALKAAIETSGAALKFLGNNDALSLLAIQTNNFNRISLVDSVGSTTGKVVQFGTNTDANDYSGTYFQKNHIAIDATKLYRLKYRYRRVLGDNGIYIGLHLLNADKTSTVVTSNALYELSYGSQALYAVANGKPTLGAWATGEYYYQGKSTGASTGSGTLASPRTFPANAAYLSILLLANYSTGLGQQEVDYIYIEDAEAIAQSNANADAITTTNATVATIDGKTTTNTNNITTLQGKMTAVEGSVATKAEASALNNYYTKTAADTAAAGQIKEFNAALISGGNNYLENATFDSYWYFSKSASPVAQGTVVSGWLEINTELADGFAQWQLATSYGATKVREIKAGTYTLSFEAYVVEGEGKTTILMRGATVGDSSFSNFTLTSTPTRYTKTITMKDFSTDTGLIRLLVTSSNIIGRIRLRNFQLEAGSVATPYAPAVEDSTNAIKANATAITATNTEVARVNGVVTSNSLDITSLENSVTTINGNLATKADASALNSLTARVVTEEGKSTSQGTAITALQNTVNHATTGLSTKASSAALTAVDNKVAAVDGRVTATNSNVSTLSGRVDTVEGAVATKAEATALNAYYTKVQADTAIAGQITAYKATVDTALGSKLNASVISNYYTSVQTDNKIESIAAGKIEEFRSESGASSANVVINPVIRPEMGNPLSSGSIVELATEAAVNTTSGTAVKVDVSNASNVYTTAVVAPAFRTISTTGTTSMACSEGDTITYEFEVLTTVSRNIRATFDRMDASNANIGTVIGTPPEGTLNSRTIAANVWSRCVGQMVVPAGVQAIRAVCRITTGDAGTVYVRNIRLYAESMSSAALATTITTTTETLNGVKGVHALKIDTNGVISGYGLVSELIDGVVKSQFGVNANTFFIGAPSSNKKPFIVLTAPGNINGVTVPAGTYIDTAFIADATIDTAQIRDLNVTSGKIANLAVTTAKIGDSQITTAKIGNLQVDTLKIKDNAVTVPGYFTDFSTLSSTYIAQNGTLILGSVQLTGIEAGQSVLVFCQAAPKADGTGGGIGASSANKFGFIELAIYQNETKVRILTKTAYTVGYQQVYVDDGAAGYYVTQPYDIPAVASLSFYATPILVVAAVANPTISIRALATGSSATAFKTGATAIISLGVKK